MGKRIRAALLCKTLPKDDNPAEYVNGSSSSPSRNLVTAIKLAGYVVHCGTGGKVSAVDGDGREVRHGTERARMGRKRKRKRNGGNGTRVCLFRFGPTMASGGPARFGCEGTLRMNRDFCVPQPACERL